MVLNKIPHFNSVTSKTSAAYKLKVPRKSRSISSDATFKNRKINNENI
jgi:hypothetical protein